SVVCVRGLGATGRGEHVGWTSAAHAAFRAAAGSVPRGRWRLDAWVAEVARRPRHPYDRAALEAAAIDLALRQAGTDLFRLLGVTPQPVRYVVSFGRVRDPCAEARHHPGVELKVDVDPAWDDDVYRALAALGRVAVLDFKGSGDAAPVARPRRAVADGLAGGPAPGPDGRARLRGRGMTEPDLAALQAILDRSTRTATPAVADSLAYPERQMTAAEFVEFWKSVRLVAMATVGPGGQPHVAPVHAEIAGASLRLVVYTNTVRR